jgi:hypothetical protein
MAVERRFSLLEHDHAPVASPWIAATLLNSWVNYDASTYGAASYYKDTNGRVHLRGLLSATTASGGGPALGPSTVLTLPVGFRPPVRAILLGVAYDGTHEGTQRIDVLNTGDVYYNGLSGVGALSDNILFLSIAGISFLTV